ncbi:hypothetical protein D3C71_2113950 [compost metagenome]
MLRLAPFGANNVRVLLGTRKVYPVLSCKRIESIDRSNSDKIRDHSPSDCPTMAVFNFADEIGDIF